METLKLFVVKVAVKHTEDLIVAAADADSALAYAKGTAEWHEDGGMEEYARSGAALVPFGVEPVPSIHELPEGCYGETLVWYPGVGDGHEFTVADVLNGEAVIEDEQ